LTWQPPASSPALTTTTSSTPAVNWHPAPPPALTQQKREKKKNRMMPYQKKTAYKVQEPPSPRSPAAQLDNLTSQVPSGRESIAYETQTKKEEMKPIELKREQVVASTGTINTGSVLEIPEQKIRAPTNPGATTTLDLPVRPVFGDNSTALPSTAMDTSATNPTGMQVSLQPTVQPPAALALDPRDSRQATPLPSGPAKETTFSGPAEAKAMDVDPLQIFGPGIGGDDKQQDQTTTGLMAMAQLQALSHTSLMNSGDMRYLEQIRAGFQSSGRDEKQAFKQLDRLSDIGRSALLGLLSVPQDAQFVQGFHPLLREVAGLLSRSDFPAREIVERLAEDPPQNRPLPELRRGQRVNIEEEIPDYRSIVGRFADPPVPLHPAQEQRRYDATIQEFTDRLEAQRSGRLIGNMVGATMSTGAT
jgi:hypothetical protein